MSEKTFDGLTFTELLNLAIRGSDKASDFLWRKWPKESPVWKRIAAVVNDINTFSEGDDRAIKLKADYSVKEFVIFMEGAKWMYEKVRPWLHDQHREVLEFHPGSETTGPTIVKAKKRYRMEVSIGNLRRAITHNTRNGKTNWEATARELGFKDGKSVKDRASYFGLT